jgi:hypothetical protein
VSGQIYAPAVLPHGNFTRHQQHRRLYETQSGSGRFVGQIYIVTIPRMETLLLGEPSTYPVHYIYELFICVSMTTEMMIIIIIVIIIIIIIINRN